MTGDDTSGPSPKPLSKAAQAKAALIEKATELAVEMEGELSTKDAERVFRTTDTTFVKGVVDVSGLPEPDRPEVAFAGRSNVGKSSLLNALVDRKDLARTSNTPGRTQEINYFAFGERAYFVDLPGYGFARAPKSKVDAWNVLIRDYLRGRVALQRVFLLIDSRHGMKEIDHDIATLLDKSAVSYQLVLTKLDKLKPGQATRIVEATRGELAKHPAAFPRLVATSSAKRSGLDRLRAEVLDVISDES